MEISALAEAVYEDLEPSIVAARRTEEDSCLELTLECDDWSTSGARRVFKLKCFQVKESNLTIGQVGGLDFVTEHPILSAHTGEHGGLFFSSAPYSPEEVFFVAHSILSNQLTGWRTPEYFLNGRPDEIHEYLTGGYGLLARGPIAVLEHLRTALISKLRVNLVPTHVLGNSLSALLFGEQFVVCKWVEVREGGA